MAGSLREKAEKIVRTLDEKGFRSYFAGGCVRDMIMKNEPKDYDIATSAQPDDVIKLFKNVIPVGKEFGVVLVVIDRCPFEVATFRKEGAYLDGRRPSSVKYTDEEEDARRRDFTINGLFYDPLEDQYHDYVGGKDDIKTCVIRSIGDPMKRLEEDRLRIIRGVRFASRFRFGIEKKTEQAIKELAPMVASVSAERIRDELVKILLDPYPHEGVRLMFELGVLDNVLPEVSAMDGVEQPPNFHPEGDVLTHTLLMLEMMQFPSAARIALDKAFACDPDETGADITENRAVLAMGVLLHDVGKPGTMEVKDRIRFNNHTDVGAKMSEKIMKRLRFSRKDTQAVSALVKNHLKFIEVRNMRESTLKRFLMIDGFEDHLELHRLDCLASHGDVSNYDFCLEKLIEMKKISPKPPKLITGEDLIRLGFKPGPLFREVLTYVEDLHLEDKVKTKEEAIEAVKEKFGKKDPG
jgi:poly(A) polymerase